MHHPFINDLSDKSMEDIQNAMNDLTKKLNFAYRMQNSPMIGQLHMIMESYRDEYARRVDAQTKKQNMGNKINISGDKQ